MAAGTLGGAAFDTTQGVRRERSDRADDRPRSGYRSESSHRVPSQRRPARRPSAPSARRSGRWQRRQAFRNPDPSPKCRRCAAAHAAPACDRGGPRARTPSPGGVPELGACPRCASRPCSAPSNTPDHGRSRGRCGTRARRVGTALRESCRRRTGPATWRTPSRNLRPRPFCDTVPVSTVGPLVDAGLGVLITPGPFSLGDRSPPIYPDTATVATSPSSTRLSKNVGFRMPSTSGHKTDSAFRRYTWWTPPT
jgi:hypothetical protein